MSARKVKSCPYVCNYVPYLARVMEDIEDPAVVRIVTITKGTSVGMTTTLALKLDNPAESV